MDNSTSEIVKLTERIAKDPKSKLFVPLAEEYKKAGDIEMSIHVLTEGLKHNPGYITAKSFLGRLLLENGDLAGAQKEFEEVIKAIPDNLLAHRKLGDIYALKGDTAKALEQYRSTLSLNAGDEEIPALIADLEAGKPIQGRLSIKPKPQAAPSGRQNTQQPAAAAPAAQRTPAPTALHAGKTAAAGEEEPEEVLVVEPLEPPQERPAAGVEFDFLAEAAPQSPQPVRLEDPAVTAPFAFAGQQEAPQELDAVEVISLSPATEETAPAAEPAKAADDFTTNTLAELYISQGFYDKALDIYERMVADNPGNAALQQKLNTVRALAGQSASAATPEPKALFGGLEPGAGMLAPEPANREAASGSGVGSEIAWEPGATLATPESLQQEPGRSGMREPGPSTADFPGPGGVFDIGYTPTEYKPPQPSGETEPKRTVEAGARAVPAARKETIDRLEHWLRNIMKENRS